LTGILVDSLAHLIRITTRPEAVDRWVRMRHIDASRKSLRVFIEHCR
jgi:hypothetical protein